MDEPQTPRRWRNQPLFISSTFRDMQAERDHLHDVVFPALEEWLRTYHTLLEPLDLRWGVETSSEDEAERKEHLVLKVCLDGVAECRPYVIVLLGDRYGWCPPPERLSDTAVEHGFRAEDVAGMSVTALEIDAGVLGDPEQAPRSVVYLREALPYDEMPGELRPVYSDAQAGNADAAERLEALKGRLRNDTRVQCCRDYALDWDPEHQRPTTESLRVWGEQVLEDLKAALAADIEAHAAQSGELTWRDEEAFELDTFVEHRARTFVGREATIAEAEALAFGSAEAGGPWAALYTGAAGAGKSALIAELYRRWRERDDALVLAHSAGISPRSAWITPMLRRWIGQLAAVQGIEEPVTDDDDHERVVEAFLDLVTAVAEHRRVVLLIDAINQFDSRAWQDQSWVPAGRSNIRLIATAIPGAASERLHEAHEGVEARELPALSAAEADEIATALCERYRKTLAPNVRQALQGQPSAANVLWLRMAIDELLLLDADDFEQAEQQYADRAPDERIPAHMEHLLTEVFPADVPGMYGYLLGRLEERFGTETVRAFALAIALSRSGWGEQGLRALVPRLGGTWDDAVGANLRRAFRLHLIRHGDPPAWDFFHPIAREAVLAHYPATQEERRTQHAQIAAYLAELPDDDPIAARECMHHLIEADDIPAAASFYADLDTDHPAHGPATDSIAERIIEGEASDEDNPGLILVQRLLDKATEAPEEWLQLPNNLMMGAEQEVRGNVLHETAHAFMARVHQWYVHNRPVHASEYYMRALMVSHGELGRLEYAAGDPQAARAHYKQCLAFNMNWHARIGSLQAARHLSVNYEHLAEIEHAAGNLDTARSHHEQALALRQGLHRRVASAKIGEELATSYSRLGELERSVGNPEAARSHHEQALALRQKLHRDNATAETAEALAVSCGHLATFEYEFGNLYAARSHNDQALALQQDLHARIARADTSANLAVTHERSAHLDRAEGNWQAARLHHEQALALRQALHGRIASTETAQALAVSQSNLGQFELEAGNPQAARSYYERALALRQNLHARIESANIARDLSVSHEGFGDLEHAAGNTEAARSHYEQALSMRQDLHARVDSAETARDLVGSHNKLGDLELAAGNPAPQAARSHYETALEIAKARHARIESVAAAREPGICHGKVGKLELAEGNRQSARYHHEQALAITSDLHARCTSAETARDLAGSYEGLGELERAERNLNAARSCHEHALALTKDLCPHMPGAGGARDLLVRHLKLGDLERATGNLRAARSHLEQALVIAEDLHSRVAADDSDQNLAVTHQYLGSLERAAGNRQAARSHYETALALFQNLDARSESAVTPRDQAITRIMLGDLERTEEALKVARSHYEQALIIAKDRHARISSVQTARDLAASHTKLGELEHVAGNLQVVRTHFEEVLTLYKDLHARVATSGTAHNLAVSHGKLGEFEHAAGKLDAARSHHEWARALFHDLYTCTESAQVAGDVCVSLYNLAKCASAQRDQAREYYYAQELYTWLSHLVDGGHDLDRWMRSLFEHLRQHFSDS